VIKKEFIIVFAFLTLSVSACMSLTPQSDYNFFKSYIAHSEYNKYIRSYIGEALSGDLKECKEKYTQNPNEITTVTKPVLFKRMGEFVMWSDHSYGHPIQGEWVHDINIQGCGKKHHLKVYAEARPENLPLITVKKEK
jgi:hypothetical protein